MAIKQLPPVRLNPEALTIIKKYQDQLAAKQEGYVRIYPSDAVIEMDMLITSACTPGNFIDKDVLYKGDKTYINMPKDWKDKKVRITELK
jgi:hypothetical protein